VTSPLPENSIVVNSVSSLKTRGLGLVRSKVEGASWKKASKSNFSRETSQP
jgi:hypothetical protein